MQVLTRFAAALAAASALATQAPAAPLTAVDEFAMMQNALRASHADGDSAAYLTGSRNLHDFLNGSPRATLQLMSAETGAGDFPAALHAFSQYASMGQAAEDALNSKAFDALRALPGYREIHAKMAVNAAPRSSASLVFGLPSARVPEDIDYDPAKKLFYISTVLSRQILRINAAGRAEVFADSPDCWPMMALKVDPARGRLWATEVAIDGFASAAKSDWGRSVILQYDLDSGKLLHRIEGPPKAALGDMALEANGDVIVSDGELGGIYRADPATLKLERIDAGDFISPQTPAVLPDGKQVLVPDYLRGIGVLDLASKRVQWLPMDGRHALSGIDGLYAVGSSLIATQNGASPERVVRFVLNESRSDVLSERILERATPTLGDPTHGVIIGGYFYYIANSGWDVLDEHGNVVEGKSLPVSTVRRAKIT